MTVQDIINTVTEQDEYRREAAIRQAIYDWAVSKLQPCDADKERMITGVDYETGEATFVDRLTSEIEAEAAQARIALFMSSGLHYKAAKFRQLMQAFFGPGAEVNRTITADYVTGFFMQATGLTGDQVRDGIFLKELFAELSAWNGGETWTLPWSVVP